jgi:tetratricopeptide (TPR) repeat protein
MRIVMTPWLCRLVIAALTVACIVCGGVSRAAAQASELKATAKQYVTDGLKAQEAGRYDEAISLYNKAYELVPHPELLFNLGQAHRLKGEKAIALNYYQKYLAVDSRGRGAREAGQWITQIDLELRAEAEALRKAEEDRKAAAEAVRKAAIEEKERQAREAEAKRQRDAERRAVASSTFNESEETWQQSDVDSQPAPDEYEPRILTGKRFVALGFAGGALIASGGWYFYYVRGHSRNEMYERSDPEGCYQEVDFEDCREERQSLLDLADRDIRRSNIFFLSGIALLGVGTFLWFTGADERPSSAAKLSRVSPVVNDEMAGVMISGGF